MYSAYVKLFVINFCFFDTYVTMLPPNMMTIPDVDRRFSRSVVKSESETIQRFSFLGWSVKAKSLVYFRYIMTCVAVLICRFGGLWDCGIVERVDLLYKLYRSGLYLIGIASSISSAKKVLYLPQARFRYKVLFQYLCDTYINYCNLPWTYMHHLSFVDEF